MSAESLHQNWKNLWMYIPTGWLPIVGIFLVCLAVPVSSANALVVRGAGTIEDETTKPSETSSKPELVAPQREPARNERPASKSTGSNTKKKPKTSGWANPIALNKELDELAKYVVVSNWTSTTQAIIRTLVETPELSDPVCKATLENLARQVKLLDNIIVGVSTVPTEVAANSQGEFAAKLRSLKYKIKRRLDVWNMVHELASSEIERMGQLDDSAVGNMLQVSNSKLRINGIDQGWIEYLELEPAVRAFNSLNPDVYEQKRRARAVLARFYSPALSLQQSEYLDTNTDEQLVDALKFRAADQVDLHMLLKRLEEMEYRDSGATSYRFNDQYQNLVWSNTKPYHHLALELHKHYRNANVRLAVSETLINRLIPQQPVTNEPFRDHILGANVYGQNQIANHIHVDLIPDPNQIQLRLQTEGRVESKTRAQRSGFTVHNEGTSRFRVIKRLAFGRNGVSAGQPITSSSVKQRTTGMRSNLDSIPLLGWMARKIAQQKIQDQAPQTERITRRKIETSAQQRFEQEVEQSLTRARHYMNANLLQPLIALDLDPEPLEIKTTTDRIVMRYRLAGRDQMAAYTARPRALKSSLLSMQFHQSAINNLLQRMDLEGKKFSLPELAAHLEERVGIQFDAGEHADRDVEFEFARFDPLRVDFHEDRISVTLNLMSFRLNKKTWKKLRVRSDYLPTTNGTQIILDQDEGVSLKGYRLRTFGQQAAVRTIFTKLFKQQYVVDVLPPKMAERLKIDLLQIGQLVVNDGWIGISMTDRGPNQSIIESNQAKMPMPGQRIR